MLRDEDFSLAYRGTTVREDKVYCRMPCHRAQTLPWVFPHAPSDLHTAIHKENLCSGPHYCPDRTRWL
jgi:hypothetical protein